MDRQTKAMNEARSREKFMKERGWTESEIDIFIKSFVEGSEWSIESAYHQPSDKPIEGEMILCEAKGFPMISGPKHEDFNETVEHFGITRWAYTNDLMPGVVDSPEKKSINPQFKKGDVVVFKPYEKCMELGDFYNIPYEYRREYKLCQFTVEGFELKHNHIFYTLKSSQFPPISTPECFLGLIGNSLQVPEIKVANPKYIIGQSVVIKSEKELRNLYGQDADLTDLSPYFSKVVVIIDVITAGSKICYEVRQYHEKAIRITEDTILCNADQRSNVEPLECPNVQWNLVAPDAEMAYLDTSKLNPSPMEEWQCIYKRMKKILSSASPEFSAFVSGMLSGLSEQFMPCSSPVIMAENKENCDSTVYIALAEDVEKYPKYVRGENFLSGTFVLKEGKSFIGYRFYKWNVVFHSVYLGLTSNNRMKGFTVTMKMYVGNYPKSFVKEIFNRFLGKDVVVLFKEDSLPYYRCLYRRSGNSAVLDYQENGIDPTCFSVTASPIECPDMLLEEKDFPIDK